MLNFGVCEGKAFVISLFESFDLSFACMQLRFGKVYKYLSNTNIFEHAGKYYSVAENDVPQEIDICTQKTLGNWDVNGAWKRLFTNHPKVPPPASSLCL